MLPCGVPLYAAGVATGFPAPYIEASAGGFLAPPWTSAHRPALSLRELQRIKAWHLAHKHTHPLAYQLWDAVLTLWVMGGVGGLPAPALAFPLAGPLCLLGMATLQL